MRIAVFASGGGSNFQAIADSCRSGVLPASVELCVASREGSGVIRRAEDLGVSVHILEGSTAKDWSNLITELGRFRVDFIALAGFMTMIPAALIKAFPNRIVNIHPALLPDFGGQGMYGRRVHEAVIASGVGTSGATVHLVDEDYDTGPIVLQESVEITPSDTARTLAAKVLVIEHTLYPRALALFARNLILVNDRKITITSGTPLHK